MLDRIAALERAALVADEEVLFDGVGLTVLTRLFCARVFIVSSG